MASDYARQGRLDEVSRSFNDARNLGSAGRQDRSPQSFAATPNPSHSLDPENYYGLAYLYAKQQPEVWPAPQAEAPGAAFRRDFAHDGAETRSPQGHSVGSSEDLWATVAVRDTHAHSALGFGSEVVGDWLAGSAAAFGVGTVMVFLKKHRLSLTLWSLALFAVWLVPGPL